MASYGTARQQIDFRQVIDRTDLSRIIDADLGPSHRGRWNCCYHDDHRPSLSISPDGKSWRCWSCGEHGDAIDWLVKRDGLTVIEAAKRLDGPFVVAQDRSRRPSRPAPAADAPSAAYLDPTWQRALDQIVRHAESNLWGIGGRAALDWLRARGLPDHVITRHRLGWLPSDVSVGPTFARRGITIPWLRPGSWYSPRDDESEDVAPLDPGPRWVGMNVRGIGDFDGPPPDRKYAAATGSTRGFPFPWCEIAPDVPTIILEGELDALLATHSIGHIVNAVTLGGTSQPPDGSALTSSPTWLLAFDNDDPGRKASIEWRTAYPERTIRVWLPANDLTEFIVAGGDPVAWLVPILRKYGLPIPACATNAA